MISVEGIKVLRLVKYRSPSLRLLVLNTTPVPFSPSPPLILEVPFVLIRLLLKPEGFVRIPFSTDLLFACNVAFWGLIFAAIYQWRKKY